MGRGENRACGKRRRGEAVRPVGPLVSLVVGAALLAACQLGNFIGPGDSKVTTTPVSSGNGWTILVYMNGDGNSLATQAFTDFMNMETVNLSGKSITVLALIDLGAGGVSNSLAWPGARLYQLAYDPAGSSATTIASQRLGSSSIGVTTTGTDDDVDMGSESALSAFIGFAKSTYPAQHYALILWGSADGWRDLGIDGASSDPLYIAKLGQAVSGQNLDVIGLDMPGEALLETAYQLQVPQGTTHQYMVASENTTPAQPSWDLAGFLNNFSGSSLGALDLVNAAVTSYETAQGSTSGATISAVDLTLVGPVATALSTFATALQGQITSTTERTLVQQSVYNNVQSYRSSDDDTVDLVDLAQYVSSSAPHSLPSGLNLVSSQAATLVSAVQGAVVADWNSSSGGVTDSHGLAVEYVPLSSGTTMPSLFDPGTGAISYYSGASVTYPLSLVTNSTWPPGGTSSSPGPGGLLYYLWLKSTFP